MNLSAFESPDMLCTLLPIGFIQTYQPEAFSSHASRAAQPHHSGRLAVVLCTTRSIFYSYKTS